MAPRGRAAARGRGGKAAGRPAPPAAATRASQRSVGRTSPAAKSDSVARTTRTSEKRRNGARALVDDEQEGSGTAASDGETNELSDDNEEEEQSDSSNEEREAGSVSESEESESGIAQDSNDYEEEEESEESGSEGDGFEDQGSSSDDDELLEAQAEDSDDEGDNEEGEEKLPAAEFDESTRRTWSLAARDRDIDAAKKDGTLAVAQALHADDLSSDDEASGGPRNTIGRVPLHWYDEYDHIGYDKSGEKLAKSKKRPDAVDAALAASDDPSLFARTVYDAYDDREVVLSQRELELVRRIQAGAFPHPEFDAYPDYVDWATREPEKMPISSRPPPKRSFLPSKWEMMKVHKIVQGIKAGRIVLDRKKAEKPETYDMWKDGEEEKEPSRKGPMHIPAPKVPLPGHAESYRPPEEYLLTEEELKQWEEMEPSERPHDFIPKRFDSLRQVGAHAGFVKERFERCLDLYLCPRAFKRRLNIDPESLVPQLPRPRDLKPFPNVLAQLYTGHTSQVRCVTCLPDGQHLASGDEDGFLILWEVATARQVRKFDLTRYGAVARLEANPVASHNVLAAAAGPCIVILAAGTASGDSAELTDALCAAVEAASKANAPAGAPVSAAASSSAGAGMTTASKAVPASWEAVPAELLSDPRDSNLNKEAVKKGGKAAGKASGAEENSFEPVGRSSGVGVRAGVRAVLRRSNEVNWIAWHHKGDYLVSVVPTAGAAAVVVTQVSKAASQCPFRRSHGEVQAARFHPSKPFLFVATKQHVRVYHLAQQTLVKKLLTGCKWIATMDIHSSGDHLILGSYDRRVTWFDLDLSSMPFRTLRYHTKAVRAAIFHKAYPLMATASDDGCVHIFHTTVYSDLLRNPLIVPLKILRGHEITSGGLGVLALAWHPKQPWLLSAGADGTVRLYQDI